MLEARTPKHPGKGWVRPRHPGILRPDCIGTLNDKSRNRKRGLPLPGNYKEKIMGKYLTKEEAIQTITSALGGPGASSSQPGKSQGRAEAKKKLLAAVQGKQPVGEDLSLQVK